MVSELVASGADLSGPEALLRQKHGLSIEAPPLLMRLAPIGLTPLPGS